MQSGPNSKVGFNLSRTKIAQMKNPSVLPENEELKDMATNGEEFPENVTPDEMEKLRALKDKVDEMSNEHTLTVDAVYEGIFRLAKTAQCDLCQAADQLAKEIKKSQDGEEEDQLAIAIKRKHTEAQGGSISPVPEDGAGDRPPFERKDGPRHGIIQSLKNRGAQGLTGRRQQLQRALKWMRGDDDEEEQARPAKAAFNLREAVSPPGFKHTVEHMKERHGDEIDNPFALAWWMKNKGYKGRKTAKTKHKCENDSKKKS